MSTARKVVLVIATALVLGGSAISLGAFAAADFRLENLSNVPRDWTAATDVLEPESEAPHTAIVVEGGGGDVRFEASSADAIEISYWNGSRRTTEITDEGGVLHVVCTSNPRVGVMIMDVDFTDRSTVVRVPASFTGSIDIATDSGNAQVDGLSSLDALSMATGGGNAHVGRTAAQTIELRADDGVVDANDVTANSLSASAGNGGVQLASIEATGTVAAQSENGDIAANDVKAASFSATATSGSIDLSGIAADAVETFGLNGNQRIDDVAAATFNARASDGSIDAAIAANSATVQADNGNVVLAFAGSADEYAIDASSANGHVNAPEGAVGAAKRIVVRATDGNIDIAFDKGDASVERGADEAPAAPAAPTAPSAS